MTARPRRRSCRNASSSVDALVRPSSESGWPKELRGYDRDDELPSYRIANAIVRIDGQAGFYHIKGEVIGPEDLPEVVRETGGYDNTLQFRQGLGELEAHARQEKDTIRFTREIRLSPRSNGTSSENESGFHGASPVSMFVSSARISELHTRAGRPVGCPALLVPGGPWSAPRVARQMCA